VHEHEHAYEQVYVYVLVLVHVLVLDERTQPVGRFASAAVTTLPPAPAV
jgi:hypothetical protein